MYKVADIWDTLETFRALRHNYPVKTVHYLDGIGKPNYSVPAIRLEVIQQSSGAISVISEDRDYSIVTWYNID